MLITGFEQGKFGVGSDRSTTLSESLADNHKRLGTRFNWSDIVNINRPCHYTTSLGKTKNLNENFFF